MQTVGIVGVGLIGGSLGLALKRVRSNRKPEYRVCGVGRSLSSLKKARKRGALDRFSTIPSEIIPLCDIVVLAVPVQFIVPVAKKILPHLKKGAVLTDVGSVKRSIAQNIQSILSRRKDVVFVGAHPIAGSEKTGVENASPDLFRNATTVLTGSSKNHPAMRKIFKMWKDTGAKCILMTTESHDRFLALTSHLPHLISFSLFSLVDSVGKKNRLIKSVVGGSFRDMTRISASDPNLWAGIFSLNQKELKSAAHSFVHSFQKLLRLSQSGSTLSKISRAKKTW